MSVILDFAMFPLDKGISVSPYVGRILNAVDRSGFDYQLTPMGTIVEADNLGQMLDLVEAAYGQLADDCDRVYATVKLDIRKGQSGRLKTKIAAVERQLGKKAAT